MMRTAFRANPFTNREVLNKRIFISTARAGLATWIECRNLNYNTVSLRHLVSKLTKKLRPRHIGYRLCEMMVAEHTLHIQVFNAHHLVFVGELVGLFAKKVATNML